jgi:hypothetical protein
MKDIRLRSVAIIVVTGLSMGVVSRFCIAQESPPEFGIKEDTPRTGSLLRRDEVHSTVLPVNRTYEQLTPEQRAAVSSWYEKVAPGDEPPFPLNGLGPMFDAIRKGQEILLVSGKLYLVATVEPNGRVSTVKAYGSPSPEMTKFAAKVLILTKFKPAVCGGRPCRMDFPIKYSFDVN